MNGLLVWYSTFFLLGTSYRTYIISVIHEFSSFQQVFVGIERKVSKFDFLPKTELCEFVIIPKLLFVPFSFDFLTILRFKVFPFDIILCRRYFDSTAGEMSTFCRTRDRRSFDALPYSSYPFSGLKC